MKTIQLNILRALKVGLLILAVVTGYRLGYDLDESGTSSNVGDVYSLFVWLSLFVMLITLPATLLKVYRHKAVQVISYLVTLGLISYLLGFYPDFY